MFFNLNLLYFMLPFPVLQTPWVQDCSIAGSVTGVAISVRSHRLA
jgi:hypothetical protein